jgi:Uma2 family endonuclease
LPAALGRGCHAYINDVLLAAPNGRGYYPDIFVVCDRSLDTARVKYRPLVIVEVLSESTAVIDRIEKWADYQEIPSLQQYVLLSQDQPLAEVYSRQGTDGWQYERVREMLAFPSLQCDVPLALIYQNLP